MGAYKQGHKRISNKWGKNDEYKLFAGAVIIASLLLVASGCAVGGDAVAIAPSSYQTECLIKQPVEVYKKGTMYEYTYYPCRVEYRDK